MRHKLVTIIGALVSVFGIISTPDMLSIMPPKVAHVVTAVGVVVAMLGRSLLAPTNAAPDPGMAEQTTGGQPIQPGP